MRTCMTESEAVVCSPSANKEALYNERSRSLSQVKGELPDKGCDCPDDMDDSEGEFRERR